MLEDLSKLIFFSFICRSYPCILVEFIFGVGFRADVSLFILMASASDNIVRQYAIDLLHDGTRDKQRFNTVLYFFLISNV